MGNMNNQISFTSLTKQEKSSVNTRKINISKDSRLYAAINDLIKSFNQLETAIQLDPKSSLVKSKLVELVTAFDAVSLLLSEEKRSWRVEEARIILLIESALEIAKLLNSLDIKFHAIANNSLDKIKNLIRTPHGKEILTEISDVRLWEKLRAYEIGLKNKIVYRSTKQWVTENRPEPFNQEELNILGAVKPEDFSEEYANLRRAVENSSHSSYDDFDPMGKYSDLIVAHRLFNKLLQCHITLSE